MIPTRSASHSQARRLTLEHARGAEFLTPPVDHGREIRCYVRDPDGHLIEIGQATGILREQAG